MDAALRYTEEHQPRFIEELKDLLRIPSVSTDAAYKDEVKRAAEWIADHCRALGLTQVQIFETPGHPIVYAEWLGAGDAPTVLAYGHYDVQPPGDDALWQSKPFEPEIREGNIYARGAVDDKGQMFIHLKTFEAYMKSTGSFPVNLKLIIEGEEETGSKNLEDFVNGHLDLLKADVVVISDTGMLAPGQPAIVYGLRGIVEYEIEVFGPTQELHSGTYGGAVQNPIQALCQLLGSMYDVHGHVTIPHFYDDVDAITEHERQVMGRVPFTEETLKQETGAPQSWGEPEFSLKERMWARPTLEINGIIGGYTGTGHKNVIPPSALAKMTCRLVTHQNPHKIFELVEAYVKANVPPSVRAEVRYRASGFPAIVSLDAKPMQLAVEVFKAVFGVEPVLMRAGGSIPVVALLQSTMGLESVLLGFGLPDDGIHAPNEKFSLEQFRLGIQTLIRYYGLLAA